MREPLAVAFAEVGRTTVGRLTALVMTATFVGLIVAVPLFDLAHVASHGALRVQDAKDILSEGFTFPVHRGRVDSRNAFRSLEQAVETGSLVKNWVQPRVQTFLTGRLGVGNRKVVIGRDGWLFYRPGVDYVIGPGFLGPLQHEIVPRNAPDPRPAIRAFHAACSAAGVRLVLMPIPDKVMIHPEKLSGTKWAGDPPDNPDYAGLIEGLDGVDVYRPLQELSRVAEDGPAFLREDTHWTPAAMEAVAHGLAAHLDHGMPGMKRATKPVWRREEKDVARVGDLVDSLKLTTPQDVFAPEHVTIRRVVRDSNGEPWRPSEDAKVLLLGDSFTNVYTLTTMGWGDAAGLAPQLSWELGRDVDVIAVNGGGASGAMRALGQRDDPLAGKRVVVWQFAARDLAAESWDVVPIRVRTRNPRPTNTIVLLAELSTPPPHSVPTDTPYEDAVVFLKFRVRKVLEGAYASGEVLVEMPYMKGRKLLAPAAYRAGQMFRLSLVPKVPAEWDGQRVIDETNEIELTPLWADRAEVTADAR
jgi:alginate O-acetyltransferase complex protein AlgJ